jgi:hypothetical protein
MILFGGELEYGLWKNNVPMLSIPDVAAGAQQAGPGCLHSHSVVKFLNAMILFGGELEYGLWKNNVPMFSVPDVAASAQQAGHWLPTLPLCGQVPQRHDPLRRRVRIWPLEK